MLPARLSCSKGGVRNVNEGRAVRSLEYEAFDELALKEGSLIVEEAQRQFPIEAAACVHRTGHLQVGRFGHSG